MEDEQEIKQSFLRKDILEENYDANVFLEFLITKKDIKNSKYEFLINRTMDLNDRLDEVMNQSTSKFNIIKDNVSLNEINI